MSEGGSWLSSGFNSISGLIKAGVQKTGKAYEYVKDGIVNYGKCYMCKENADCDIPCGHILCHKCFTFYIESQGIPNPEFVLCYICSKPIPVQNVIIDYIADPYEEEKFPVYEPRNQPNPQNRTINQEMPKFTIYELPEVEEVKNYKNPLLAEILDSSSSSSSDEEEKQPEEIKPFTIKEICVKECPFCEWSLEISSDSRNETCTNIECKKTFCPQCNQAPHIGTPCAKVEHKIVLPHDPKCPLCAYELIKEEDCNFLWCPNKCGKTCFCLICGTYIARCEYFTHYIKAGPFGNTCNDNLN